MTKFSFNHGIGRVIIHIVFWISYIMFFFFQYQFMDKKVDPYDTLGSLFLTSFVDISAAYFTVYFLLSRFLFKRKYIQFSVYFLLSAAAAILLQRVILYYISEPLFYADYHKESQSFWHINPFYSFFNIYTVVGFFASVKLLKYWYKNQQLKLELERKNKSSELALLRTQINPHFLFNTLNNIDTLIGTAPEKASDAVIKLSEIMRFVLYEANSDSISLEKEIDYLESYISLQSLRMRNQYFVSFENNSENCRGLTIAPMIFIPFVENAFKHGLKNIVAPGIEIFLDCKDGNINFEVVNRYSELDEQNKDKTKGIGIDNARRRLELLYPDNHTLEITKHKGVFKVKLKINSVDKK